jgi:hypothetical protein
MSVIRNADVRFYDIEQGADGLATGGVLRPKKGEGKNAGTGKGKGTGTRTFYKLIFEADSKERHPLCRDIFDQTGAWTSGQCDSAAAYTVWTLTFSENLTSVYTVDGEKTPITYSITSSVTLPEWKHLATTDPDDRAEITRVTMRTAHHEAGHSRCPEEVTAAVQRFWEALPPTVPRRDVSAINAAVAKVVREFYQHLGRNIADVTYDTVTRHGYIQGAVYNKSIDKQGDDRTKFSAPSVAEALMQELVADLVPTPKSKVHPSGRRRRHRSLKCGASGTCRIPRDVVAALGVGRPGPHPLHHHGGV